MALRIPRGYERNIPYYREICEGVRPNISDLPLLPYTGLPHVRLDEFHHDPIVIDPGTLIGLVTGLYAGSGTLVPCTFATGTNNVTPGLSGIGDAAAATNFGLPGSSTVTLNVGNVKPLGVNYQPVYSSILPSKFTNYTRTANVGILCDYVISVPVTNAEEVLIESGDLVMAGSGVFYGIGVTDAVAWSPGLAGRYARFNSSTFLATERVVGRCLKKIYLGTKTSATAGDLLSAAIAAGTFTISTEASNVFGDLAKVQTVPGLGLSGSGTSGIPAYLLGARCDSNGAFFALTMLIRL